MTPSEEWRLLQPITYSQVANAVLFNEVCSGGML